MDIHRFFRLGIVVVLLAVAFQTVPLSTGGDTNAPDWPAFSSSLPWTTDGQTLGWTSQRSSNDAYDINVRDLVTEPGEVAAHDVCDRSPLRRWTYVGVGLCEL